MKPFDRWLQSRRIAMAAPHIPPGARVLDIGCFDGALFERLGAKIRSGVGIDAGLDRSVTRESYRLIAGTFPEDLQEPAASFDAITLLAVLEHIQPDAQRRLARSCAALLKPGGIVIVTVPSPIVDRIVHVLQWLRIMEGTDCEHHYGFDVRQTPRIFSDLRLVTATRFQFGLNNLFVFAK